MSRLARIFAFFLLIAMHSSAMPPWWLDRGVVSTNETSADYAPAVLGQLKWLMTNACDELEANIAGGAGDELWAQVRGYSTVSNYFTLNTGQLKQSAKLVYDRLIHVYYTTNYPWSGVSTDDCDWAIANVGQLKQAFDFDVATDEDADGLKDWWEIYFFDAITNAAPDGDFDGDNLANTAEYWHATSPVLWDTDGDTISDKIEIEEGTDPRNPISYPVASISGMIIYSGGITGQVRILAATSSNSWSSSYFTSLSGSGSYSITNVLKYSSYWVRTFIDANGNGTKDETESGCSYTNNSIYLTNAVSGVNISFADTDTDSDGLWDWVETGTSNFVNAADTGSDPEDPDSDDDGINDGNEVTSRTDPNNPDISAPQIILEKPINQACKILIP